MPPKKAAGGKKKKEGVVIDGVSTTEMTREELEVFALRLREQMENERLERNMFQLERDKIRTFWEITRNQLEDVRAQLRNKAREMEEATEKHDREMTEMQQKVKHLLYEHQMKEEELGVENMHSLKIAEDDYLEQEMEILRDKKSLKAKMEEQELAFEEQIRGIRLKNSEDITEMRNQFETDMLALIDKFEKKLTNQRNELNQRHKMELTEVEERKNKQIADLTKNHEEAFSELKNYYNDITLNSLALITSLKEQMEVMKSREDRKDKELREIRNENRKLIEPLEEARDQVAEMTRRLANYEKDRINLRHTKEKLAACQKELEDIKWENEVMESRFARMQQDRDILHRNFMGALMEVMHKTGMNNVLLEKKLVALMESMDEKEAQLQEALAHVDIQPTAMSAIQELLERKSATIQDLQYELDRVSKAHDDLLETYESKLEQYGIPTDELGFIPLRTTGDRMGRGPAGLVTVNR